MPTDKYGSSELEFAGMKVEVECDLLSSEAEAQIKNYVSRNEPGSAEVALVVATVQSLYLDGKPVDVRANKPFPRHRDEDGGSLLEFLASYVVNEERWIGKKWPAVFGKYLKSPEKDPTRSLAGAGTAS